MATPLTLAETASVFGETLVFGRLLEAAPSAGVAALAAGGVDRGLDRHGLPPGGDEPLRAPRAHRAARRGRALRRPLRRPLVPVAGRAAGRRGRGHRRLQVLVVLRPPLHRLAGLRLRVRLRAAARAGGLRALRGGGSRIRGRLPRAAERRRVQVAGGAGRDRRHRPRRPGLLGQGPGHRGAQARRGRSGRAGSGPRRSCSTFCAGGDSARLFVASLVASRPRRPRCRSCSCCGRRS